MRELTPPARPAAPAQVWLRRSCGCHAGGGGGGGCKCGGETVGDSGIDRAVASPGRPLDGSVRREAERRFGHDFSQVRVHADDTAGRAAQAVGASAWTVGRHVGFGPGRYQPDTAAGRRLLWHELAHTLQPGAQTTPRLSPADRLSEPDAPEEREAEAAADAAEAGRPVPAPRAAAGSATVHRQTDPAAARAPSAPAAAAARQDQQFLPDVQLGQFTRYNRGRADALLDRRPARAGGDDAPPCQLDLFLRLEFQFFLGPAPHRVGGPMGSVTEPGGPWPADRADRWKRRYMDVAQSMWRTRRPLERTGDCAAEPCRRAVGQLHIVDAATGKNSSGQPAGPAATGPPHYTVKVYEQRPAGIDSNVRGTQTTLFEEDVLPRTTRPPADLGLNRDFTPGGAAHETGHMLGRPHVNCGPDTENPNAERCYGEEYSSERANIMGKGDEFSEGDHQPFLLAMQAATGCNWRVASSGWPLWLKVLLGITLVGLVVLALAGQL